MADPSLRHAGESRGPCLNRSNSGAMASGFRLSPERRSGWRQAKRSFAESRMTALK
jgi:hypothetical protein